MFNSSKRPENVWQKNKNFMCFNTSSCLIKKSNFTVLSNRMNNCVILIVDIWCASFWKYFNALYHFIIGIPGPMWNNFSLDDAGG